MMILLDCRNLLQMWDKEVCPVKSLNNHASILSRNQLGDIAICRIVDDLHNGLKITYFRPMKPAFEQAKAPVRCKLCMSYHQKGKSDCQYSLNKIMHPVIILILSAAVVCVQVHFTLSKTVILEEIVESTHYSVGSFPTVTSFIRQEVDLSWESLTIDTKDSTLPGCEKIDGTWLQWI